MVISEDLTTFDPNVELMQDKCNLLTINDIVDSLVSPDTGKRLFLDKGSRLINDVEEFPIYENVPVLFPKKCHPFLGESGLDLPLKIYGDPFLQYILFSTIKMKSDINNLPSNDLWAQRHYYRAKEFLKNMRGSVLDVGCDNIHVSQKIFPKEVDYLGLDLMYRNKKDFRIIGMGEFLPFAEGSFDNVTFMTSLDHIFDYHRAIDEATRILKPQGKLYIAALVWHDKAELYHDLVHFHHFREYEIMGALTNFKINNTERYHWKNDKHRHGIYIEAQKS